MRRQITTAFVLTLLYGLPATVPGQSDRPLDPIAARLEPTRRVVYETVGDRELSLHIFEPPGHQVTAWRPVFLAVQPGAVRAGDATDGRVSAGTGAD